MSCFFTSGECSDRIFILFIAGKSGLCYTLFVIFQVIVCFYCQILAK
jgi:hypothetical protein